MRKLLLPAIAVLAVTAMANATLVMTVGSTSIVQGTPSVTLDITYDGGADNLQGLNLCLLSAAGNITAVDLTGAGKAFALNSAYPPYLDVALPSSYTIAHAATATGALANSGTLASITIDTSALLASAEPYIVSLSIDEDNVTDFAGVAVDSLVAGGITVTPEPAALALLGLGGLFIRRRRA